MPDLARLNQIIQQQLQHIDVYAYVRTNYLKVRLVALLQILSIILLCTGYVMFMQTQTIYWVLFVIPFAIFFFNRFTRYAITLCYPNFSIQKHKTVIQNFWQTETEPSVDIFLPWAGEDIERYEAVIVASKAIDYANKQIYILDDKGSSEMALIAEKHSVHYLSRPNKGEYRKAGNLAYAYVHSQGQFVLVLDSDFISHPGFLKSIVPYIVSDPKIGIIQTPQYFEQSKRIHKRSPIEYGGANVVEWFYRFDMPSRDAFGIPLCVGTSALYRRQAIQDAGGPPRVWGTEDVRQGLLVHRHGYRVKYIPLILSIGTSPDTVQGYFRQHNRWCTGSVTMLFEHYIWKSGLKWYQKLIYITNGTFYISEMMNVYAAYHLILALLFNTNSKSLYYLFFFLPHIIINRFVEPAMHIHKPRLGTHIAGVLQMLTYLYTIPGLLWGRKVVWQPAGVKNTNIQSQFFSMWTIGLVHTVLYSSVTAISIWYAYRTGSDFLYSLAWFWAIYHSLMMIIMLCYIYRFMMSGKSGKQRFSSYLFISSLRYGFAAVCFVSIIMSLFVIYH